MGNVFCFEKISETMPSFKPRKSYHTQLLFVVYYWNNVCIGLCVTTIIIEHFIDEKCMRQIQYKTLNLTD